jgi:hypothetical protein
MPLLLLHARRSVIVVHMQMQLPVTHRAAAAAAAKCSRQGVLQPPRRHWPLESDSDSDSEFKLCSSSSYDNQPECLYKLQVGVPAVVVVRLRWVS